MGQPIRLMLAYAGVDYVDKRYTLGPDMDRSEWLKDKFNLGLDFPNVSWNANSRNGFNFEFCLNVW